MKTKKHLENKTKKGVFNLNLLSQVNPSMSKICLATALFFLMVLAVTATQQTTMSLQGTATNSSGDPVDNGDLTVNISSSNSCAGDVFTNTYTNRIQEGLFNVLLGNETSLNLNYNDDYYLCTIINGELVGSATRFRGGQGEIGNEDIGNDFSVDSSGYWDNYDTPSGWDLDSSNDITTSNIANQNVNSSNYWDNLNTPADITGLGSSNINDIYLFNTGDTATGDYTFDTNTLFVDSSNNRVGIGTITPGYNLHVDGNTYITGETYLGDTNTGFDTNGNLDMYGGTISDTTDEVDIADNLAVTENIYMTDDNYIGISGAERIQFDTGGEVEILGAEVGIGTATPSNDLHIYGANPGVVIDDSGSSDPVLIFSDAGTTRWSLRADESNSNAFEIRSSAGTGRLLIEDGGDVGIGTTNPESILHVAESAATATVRIQGGTTNDANLLFGQGASTERFLIGYDDSPDGFRIYDYHGTAGTRLFVESTTGDVGIGTTNPTDKLHVVGSNSGTASTDGTYIINAYTGTTDDLITKGINVVASSSDVHSSGNLYTSGVYGIDTQATYTGRLGYAGSYAGYGEVYGGDFTGTFTPSSSSQFTNGMTIYGIRATANRGSSVNAHTETYYGGSFTAIGHTIGNPSTAYGIYVSATGADTNYAAVFASGNVGIGEQSPNSKLSIYGGVCIDDDSSCGTINNGDMAIYDGGVCIDSDGGCTPPTDGHLKAYVIDASGHSDIAEMIEVTNQNIEETDVVCADPSNPTKVTYCTEDYDTKVVGIISSMNASLIANSGCGGHNTIPMYDENGTLEYYEDDPDACNNFRPIALKGNVPVKVDCTEAISIGDILVSSDTAGYAEKMVFTELQGFSDIEKFIGSAVAKALESCGSGTSTIRAWII
ncbi:hypothetical protein HQ529_04185 [Candidatus Woesearchaeota archaeon]|nr:hypothetical protein [Candidatus Woesearchaeota archaeon]